MLVGSRYRSQVLSCQSLQYLFCLDSFILVVVGFNASPLPHKKPDVLKRLLDEELEFPTVKFKRADPPRATWKENPYISEWGLCWTTPRDEFVQISCTFILKGSTMLGHGNVLEVAVNEDDAYVYIELEPVRDEGGETNKMQWPCLGRFVVRSPRRMA